MSARRDANTVGVFFLWAIVNHNVGIRDSSVCRYVSDFIVVEYDEGIHALRSRLVITLCEIAPFFSKCCCPYRLSGGICGEFLLFCYCFAGDGVDYGGTVWCSAPIPIVFYLKQLSCLAFYHMFICVEILCEQVEGFLCDETWGLDGNWLGSSWWCLSSLGCFVWNEAWRASLFLHVIHVRSWCCFHWS